MDPSFKILNEWGPCKLVQQRYFHSSQEVCSIYKLIPYFWVIVTQWCSQNGWPDTNSSQTAKVIIAHVSNCKASAINTVQLETADTGLLSPSGCRRSCPMSRGRTALRRTFVSPCLAVFEPSDHRRREQLILLHPEFPPPCNTRFWQLSWDCSQPPPPLHMQLNHGPQILIHISFVTPVSNGSCRTDATSLLVYAL